MICRKILVVTMLTCVTPLRKKSTFEINNNRFHYLSLDCYWQNMKWPVKVLSLTMLSSCITRSSCHICLYYYPNNRLLLGVSAPLAPFLQLDRRQGKQKVGLNCLRFTSLSQFENCFTSDSVVFVFLIRKTMHYVAFLLIFPLL